MNPSSREKILKRLENNARGTAENAVPGISFLKTDERPLLQQFQEKAQAVKAEFIFCNSRNSFNQALKKVINEKKLHEIYCNEASIAPYTDHDFAKTLSDTSSAALTGCEYLVAQTGSVLVSTAHTKSRRTFAYPPVHMVLAFRNQLLGRLEEAFDLCKEKYQQHLPSQITVITGPSRTADIEKTLVLGAHGPKELIIFYLDDDFVE